VDLARAGDSLSRIQDEIQAEKAAALSRIAGTLDALLAELRRIESEVREAPHAGEREPARARHREVRDRALRYRWYLEVQREAVGFTRHEALDELYPVPAPLAG
jgi:hypothetical protein